MGSRVTGVGFDAPIDQVAETTPRCDKVMIRSWDGTALAVEVRPSATERPRGRIVFVHGFAGNRRENGLFDDLARRLSTDGFECVLYDWRGIGDSEGDFRETRIDDHVQDLEAVLAWTETRRQTIPGPLFLVGFSLGAAVVGLVLRRGARARAAVYLSPAMRPSQSMWPRYDTSQIWQEVRSRGFVQKPGSSVLLGRAILESLRDTDLGDDSFNIGIPLLVCHGTHDSRIDCANSRKLATLVRDPSAFRYVEFPGASHSFKPAQEFWSMLGTTVADWLLEESRPSRTGWRQAVGAQA